MRAKCRDGQGTGRDSLMFFAPVPNVPQTYVPVPRDTKSAGTDRDSRRQVKLRDTYFSPTHVP